MSTRVPRSEMLRYAQYDMGGSVTPGTEMLRYAQHDKDAALSMTRMLHSA